MPNPFVDCSELKVSLLGSFVSVHGRNPFHIHEKLEQKIVLIQTPMPKIAKYLQKSETGNSRVYLLLFKKKKSEESRH